MQAEMVSEAILVQMKSASLGSQDPSAVSINQLMMWLMPQKAEHDGDYDINRSYFEALLQRVISDLLAKGYITSLAADIEDGDARMFSLTQMGAEYVEMLAASDSEP